MSAHIALPVALALARSCAPQVAPETLLSVAQAESGLDPWIIGINGRPHRSLHPGSAAQAIATADDLRRRGLNFDVGLAQLNVRNLSRLGLTLEQAFDPCRNLAGGGRILTEAYLRRGELVAALSTYNTGDDRRGVRNGYVAQVYRAAARIVPAISASPSPDPPRQNRQDDDADAVRLTPTMQTPPTPAPLDVFHRGASPGVVVWRPGAPPPLLLPSPSAGAPS